VGAHRVEKEEHLERVGLRLCDMARVEVAHEVAEEGLLKSGGRWYLSHRQHLKMEGEDLLTGLP